MISIRLHSAADLTARVFGGECIVLSWRDGRRRGVDGPLATVLDGLISELGLESLYENRHVLTGVEDLESFAGLGAILSEFLEKPRGEHGSGDLKGLLGQTPSLLNMARVQRVPLYGMLEMAYVCNLRCRHCYVLHKVSEPRAARLADSQIKKVIEDLVSLGCLNVTLTGGEPTLVPAYLNYISACKDRGLYATLKTNGTTFTRRRAQEYGHDPAHETHVSLYGASEGIHDAFTAIPGSFVHTVEGLRNLSDVGVHCRVNCVVWQGNVDQLTAIRELAEASGHEVEFDDTIWGRLNGDTSPTELAISAEERERLVDAGILAPFAPAPCTAGAVKVKVDAEGGVATCELLPITFGNVNDRSLTEIWRSPDLMRFGQRAVQVSNEKRQQGALDLACPGLNILRGGSLEGSEPESVHAKNIDTTRLYDRRKTRPEDSPTFR
jgi:MoaA/NifB/PqqE/SkfB family radical SAM enzyme